MEESPPAEQESSEETKKGTGGSIVVFILMGVIVVGTAFWFSFDHGRDVLSKNTGRVFAASFEKTCQPNHPIDTCKAVAGANHTICLRKSASQTDAGIEYDQKVYIDCMRDALDSHTAQP